MSFLNAKKIDWYFQNLGSLKHIRDEEALHRNNLVRIGFAISLLLPIVSFIDDLANGLFQHIVNDVFTFAAICVYLTVSILIKSPRAMYIFMAVVTIAGIPGSIYSSNLRYVEIHTLITSAPLVFYLGSSRQGILWAIGIFVVFLGTYICGAAGLLFDWSTRYSRFQIEMLLMVFFLLCVQLHYIVEQYRKQLNRVVSQILQHPVTSLLGRQALVDWMGSHQNYSFAILRCENQYDLSLIQPEGPSSTLIETVASVLVAFASRENLSIFQLKDNEYAFVSTERIAKDDQRFIQLHDEIEDLKFPYDGLQLHLNVSVGVAFIDRLSATEAFSVVDRALQAAIRYHTPVYYYDELVDTAHESVDKLRRFSLLKTNFETRGFEVYFQPVVDAATLEPVWYEALLRLKSSSGEIGSIYPYISIAETTGLMSRLTEFVIGSAAQFMDKFNIPVSLNLSVHDMNDKILVDRLVEQANIRKPGFFILEILERDDFRKLPSFTGFLDRVKSSSCRIAIDDFGAGYSNFGTLIDLTPDLVKIDGGLVTLSKTDRMAFLLIKTLIGFCKNAGLKVVAEHIEERDQVKLFRDLGVNYLQGYLVGRPAPAGEFLFRHEVFKV